MWVCSSHTEGKFHGSCPDLRSDLPIYPPSFLSAGCVADWRGCFREKVAAVKRNVPQSLSVKPTKLALSGHFDVLPSNEFHKRSSKAISWRHCVLDIQR